MSDKKLFRVKGEIKKQHFFEPMTFNVIIPALKKEHVLQKIYAEFGSRHRAKRFQIFIDIIEEISEE
jgi:large subunit ribosomal protein LX